MAIGYSFVGAVRWEPRVDFGDSVGTTYAKPKVVMANDPFYIVGHVGASYSNPPVELRSVIVYLGVIGSDLVGTIFPVPVLDLKNLLRPQGSIGTDLVGTSFSVPPMELKDVLRSQGSIGTDAIGTSYFIPTLTCAPP